MTHPLNTEKVRREMTNKVVHGPSPCNVQVFDLRKFYQLRTVRNRQAVKAYEKVDCVPHELARVK